MLTPPRDFACDSSLITRKDAIFIRIQDHPTIWLGLLYPESKWLIYGLAELSVLCGSNIEIFGGRLQHITQLSYKICAPATHIPIDIDTLSCAHITHLSMSSLLRDISKVTGLPGEQLEGKLGCLFMQPIDLARVAAVVLLQPLPSPVIESIIQLRCFRKMFCRPDYKAVSNKFVIHGTTYSFESPIENEGFMESPELNQAMKKLFSLENITKLKIFICGPANSGKSTLLRRLTNCLISSAGVNKIAVLDFDPGQPEFTPPGMLSLTLLEDFILGPPVSHPLFGRHAPIRQCFFGGTTPAVNPTFYIECMRHIFEYFNENSALCCPLIVNTMGWTQGLGLTLLIEQILMVRPDIVIQLYQESPKSNARLNLPVLSSEFLKTASGWNDFGLKNEVFNHEVILIPSKSRCGPGGFTSSRDNRDLTILGHILSGLENAETSLPGSGQYGRGHLPLGHPTAHLLDVLPYGIPLVAIHNMVHIERPLAIHLLHEPICDFESVLAHTPFPRCMQLLAKCLNATLVALCVVSPESIISPKEPSALTLLSHALPCECVGLGIVRAFNPDLGLIYLTTGVPFDKLLRVNAIMRGKVDLPQALFSEQPLTAEALLSYPAQLQPRPPYLGSTSFPGVGRTGLLTRRHHPRVMHHPPESLRNSSQF